MNNWKNELWYSYNDYLSDTFGEKVYKVTVSAGFTCPTRDGTKGTAGCAFCDERGSSSFFGAEKAGQEIREQILKSIPFITRRYKAKKYFAYFQSFTNTYAPLSYLKSVYDGALEVPDVIGMCVGTRPDCVPNEVLELLNEYGKTRYVSLELGLQSLREDTLEFYQRGHTAAEGIEAVKRSLKYPNLKVSVHLMFGAPGETWQDAVNAAKTLNELGVHGVKIHHLMILKNTTLDTRYSITPWSLFSVDDYNFLVMKFLENLNPKIHVERTHAAASHPDELVGPKWSILRFEPVNRLRKLMGEYQSYHGKFFSKKDFAGEQLCAHDLTSSPKLQATF